jgi:MraZ protein
MGRRWEHLVALFLSTYVNKVDRKGRVSVPASFRAAVAGQSFAGIVTFRSFKTAAIEGSGIDRIEEMSARLDALEQFSEDYDNLASIFADAQQLPFDGEGRVVLPEELVGHAGISESAAFVGLGRTFQIWEPEAHKRHQGEMRERAKRQGTTLPAFRPASPAQGATR